MPVCEHLFDDKAALVQALTTRVARRLERAVAVHGDATLMVSGGGTPVAWFEAMSALALPWEHITCGLVDERWVDEQHAASNARLVREHLLQGPASKARFVPSFSAGVKIDEAVAQMNTRSPWSDRRLTVAHIGMGNDLHTASIFPGTDHSARALAPDALPVMHTFPTESPANPPFARVTLTRPALAGARLLLLLLEGDAKLERFRYAQTLAADAAPDAPIVAFMTDPRVMLEVYWSP